MKRMMKQTQLPTAVYAAAGAGDAAYEKLRQLPDTAARVGRAAGETAGQFRQRLTVSPEPLRQRIRASAERGTTAVITSASSAQERVTTGYRGLVSRGERVLAPHDGAAHEGEEDDASQVEVIVGPVQSERGNGATGTHGQRDDNGDGPASQ